MKIGPAGRPHLPRPRFPHQQDLLLPHGFFVPSTWLMMILSTVGETRRTILSPPEKSRKALNVQNRRARSPAHPLAS
jgi:hypothetical protein